MYKRWLAQGHISKFNELLLNIKKYRLNEEFLLTFGPCINKKRRTLPFCATWFHLSSLFWNCQHRNNFVPNLFFLLEGYNERHNGYFHNGFHTMDSPSLSFFIIYIFIIVFIIYVLNINKMNDISNRTINSRFNCALDARIPLTAKLFSCV